MKYSRHILLTVTLCVAVISSVLGADADSSPHPRIISLYAAHTEILLRLGARENIIGVSQQETYSGPETEGWSPPVFSFRDDVEKFLAARPDIILIRPMHIGDGRMKEALEKAGIEVRALQVTHADRLYDYWRELGALVGRQQQAEELIAAFDEEIRRYSELSATQKTKPGVFLESIHREVKTFTPASLPVWLAQTAGLHNIAADAQAASAGVVIAEYGPEKLLSHADEIDIFISQEGPMNKTDLQTILSRNIYAPIKAFREKKVYRIPEAELSRPTPALLDGLKKLAMISGLAP